MRLEEHQKRLSALLRSLNTNWEPSVLSSEVARPVIVLSCLTSISCRIPFYAGPESDLKPLENQLKYMRTLFRGDQPQKCHVKLLW